MNPHPTILFYASLIVFIVAATASDLAIYAAYRRLKHRLDRLTKHFDRIDSTVTAWPHDVPCPFCGASPGEPCAGANGFKDAHKQRYEASPAALAARRGMS